MEGGAMYENLSGIEHKVDYGKCGCPFPFEQEARPRGLKEKTFFPPT
jgi:hypothetical protein